MALLVVVPLIVVVAWVLSNPTAETLRLVVLPYGGGLAVGGGLVGYVIVRGGLSERRSSGSNRDVYLLVSAVSVPAAILLPLFLGDDVRFYIALFGFGAMVPLLPIVVFQILKEGQ